MGARGVKRAWPFVGGYRAAVKVTTSPRLTSHLKARLALSGANEEVHVVGGMREVESYYLPEVHFAQHDSIAHQHDPGLLYAEEG